MCPSWENGILNILLFPIIAGKRHRRIWFAETYGINRKSLNLEESTEKSIKVDLDSGRGD